LTGTCWSQSNLESWRILSEFSEVFAPSATHSFGKILDETDKNEPDTDNDNPYHELLIALDSGTYQESHDHDKRGEYDEAHVEKALGGLIHAFRLQPQLVISLDGSLKADLLKTYERNLPKGEKNLCDPTITSIGFVDREQGLRDSIPGGTDFSETPAL
jgi:hypothetical protein